MFPILITHFYGNLSICRVSHPLNPRPFSQMSGAELNGVEFCESIDVKFNDG